MSRFTTAGGGEGTPGPQGPQGPAGQDGADGIDGLEGPQGLAGADGLDGADGAQGPQGETGPAGDPFGVYYLGNYNSESGYLPEIAVVRGSDGQLYLAKSSGQLGDPVNYLVNGQWEVWIPKGTDGAAGLDGSDGAQGAAGADGANGLDGTDGAQGEIGFPGFKYDTRRVFTNQYTAGEIIEYNGSYFVCIASNDALPPTGGAIGVYWNPYSFVGPQGETGSQGPQGDPGAQGEPGIQGEPGLDGDPASTGDFTFTDSTMLTSEDMSLESNNGDIILNADGNVYKGSATSGNEIVSYNNMDAYIGDTTVNGSTGNTITDRIAAAVGYVDTGDITFDGIRIIGAGTAAGDGSGNATLELVPDGTMTSDQYIIIDPTEPNHIHIRAGGTQDASGADLILGGENTNVFISDGDNSVILNGSGGQFINSSANPDNQIATVGDVAAVSTGSLTSVGSNIIPSTDNVYTLGDTDHRWESVHVGPGTIYITDQTLGTDAELTVDNGVLQIDGANQLQVGQLKFIDNTIESVTPEIDIQIGLDTSTGNLILNRDTAIPQTLTVGNSDATTNPIMLNGFPLAGQIKSEVFGFGEDLQTSDIVLQRHSTIVPAIIAGAVSNSDTAEEVSVATGQNLLMLMANGYAGSDYKNFANILLGAQSEGTPDFSDTSSPGRIEFQVTPDGFTNPNTVMTIRSNGLVQHANGNLWGAQPPADAHGSPGDEYGMIAFTEQYIYYCVENYSPNNDGIWKRAYLSLHDDVEHPYTPELTTYVDQPVFGTTGPDILGRYVQNGKLIHFTIAVTFMDVIDYGTGGYKITLPFNVKHDTAFHGQFMSHAEGEYMLFGNCDAGNNVLSLKLHLSGPLTPFENSQSLPFAQYDEFTITGTYMKENP